MEKELLAKQFSTLIPDKKSDVIVYCRTGQAATVNYSILTDVLGYENVKVFDGSWTQWAAGTLPVESGGKE